MDGPVELRCAGGVLHGVLIDGRVEVKCRDRRTCGHAQGVAVFHYFDPLTGELLETKSYRDPENLFDKEKATCP
jgi:hypothetical protein